MLVDSLEEVLGVGDGEAMRGVLGDAGHRTLRLCRWFAERRRVGGGSATRGVAVDRRARRIGEVPGG